MPPKSLMTLLTGAPIETFEVGVFDESRGPLYEHRPPEDLSSTLQDNPSLNTKPVPAEELSPVPKSIALPKPIVTISGGPTLRTRQLWEGTVTEVRGDEFVAVLSDLTNPNNPDEQVVFTSDEISQDDRKLIIPGSGFYWTVGSKQYRSGQENVSIVQFRRLPTWTRSSLEQSSSQARKAFSVFYPAQ